MKYRYVYLILFSWFSISFAPTKDMKGFFSLNDCQTILDSATVFVNTGESAINYQPSINDNERNLRLDKWLRRLSFRDLRCLLDNESIPVRVMGFIYSTETHMDSLLAYYSYLLTDTTTVQIFMADGKVSPKVKLGELLSGTLQQIKSKQADFSKRPQIESTVSEFIRKYSTYPDTYRPLSFPYFSMGSDDEGLTGFKIHHDYKLTNNEGVSTRVTNAFVLDKNLKINVIAKDSTSYSYSFPSNLGYWIREFGRRLSRDDSVALRLHEVRIKDLPGFKQNKL